MLERVVEEYEGVLMKMLSGSSGSSAAEQSSQEDELQKTRGLMLRLLHVMEQLISYNKTPVLILDGLGKLRTESQIRKVRC